MREHKGYSLISLPAEYVVIDTETTGLDYEYCNLIEISALKYSGGKCIDKFTSLVKPPLMKTYFPLRNNGEGEWLIRYVDSYITDLTGITNEMLENAPLPGDVLPQLLNFIGDSILIGHNVNFDINFIYDAAIKECATPLRNNFIDTLRIARKVFPNLKHHRLADISLACSVDQPQAHRAEADCLVTAQCYEHMRQLILEDKSEEEFQNLFAKKHKNYNYANTLANISATVDDIDDTNPLFGKIVVFTGALSSMERKSAFQLVANLGGYPQDSITKKTSFLVIGNADFAKSIKDGKTSKIKKAESYQQKGSDILIISENAFFDLISDYS